MSASHSVPSEEVQKLFQRILKSPPLDYPANGCSDSTTPGQFCGPCLQLEAVDAKLYAHLEEINKLLRIRTEVKECLNQYHDPVTCHLPVEITSQIFTLYTEDFNSDFDPRFPSVVDGGPLLLGAVSKSWREIAFGTPRLWSTINILIPSIDKLPIKVELTKQWLSRSRQLPLYLSLVHRTSADQVEPEPDSLIPLFSVLQNVAPCWCELVLRISPIFYTAFLGEVTCSPILDTLRLIDEPSAEGKFYLPHTPALKHLDVQSNILLSYISIDWARLTTFEADCVTVDEFFEVLRRVEQLSSFRLRGVIEDVEEHPLPTTPLTHSSLTELYLQVIDDTGLTLSDVKTLLDLAVFPSLEKFTYRTSSIGFFPDRDLQSLFNRSRCQLTHFELSGDLEDSTSDDLISILSDLPTITHLKLEDTYSTRLEDAVMSDELLQRLTAVRRDEFAQVEGLLPYLESLEFFGYKTFSWSCLAILVSATSSDGDPLLPTTSERQGRANSIRRISFTVYFQGEREVVDTDSLAQFKGARYAGISIAIVNEVPPGKLSPVSSVDAVGNCAFPIDLLS